MQITPNCIDCMLNAENKRTQNFEDKEKTSRYLNEVKKIMISRKPEDCAPYIKSVIDDKFAEYFGSDTNLREVKKKYNDFVLNMVDSIESKIETSADPLQKAMVYARIGNYIDFAAQDDVSTDKFIELLEELSKENLETDTYDLFIEKCKTAKTFVLLCDNCGEIVLDKLFICQLKKYYPQIKVYVMVRGRETLNDATSEDALYCKIDEVAEIITNGSSVPGTVVSTLPEKEKDILLSADLVLSKGQGNYESLSGYGLNLSNFFFSFLCKCDLFTKNFGVPKFTGMFLNIK